MDTSFVSPPTLQAIARGVKRFCYKFGGIPAISNLALKRLIQTELSSVIPQKISLVKASEIEIELYSDGLDTITLHVQVQATRPLISRFLTCRLMHLIEREVNSTSPIMEVLICPYCPS